MKLNPDCVRDILLEVEERTDFSTKLVYDRAEPEPSRLHNYTHDELIYHISQCKQSGLICGVLLPDGGDMAIISDLTPDGHEFLANTRKNEVWEGTKTIAEKIGAKSLDALVQIASNVIAQLIKAQFGIT